MSLHTRRRFLQGSLALAGLGLLAGCRVVSHHHYGAAGEVVDCSDWKSLAVTLSRLIARGRTLKNETGEREPTQAAASLAALLAATWELPAEQSRP